MNYLGIDYGLSHIGLAISYGILAEPLAQLDNISDEQSAELIGTISRIHDIDKIIVGISEGSMAERTKLFADTLKKLISIPVVFVDETLSSQEASQLLVQSGAKRMKRQTKQHQTAAALILQRYLEDYTHGLYSD